MSSNADTGARYPEEAEAVWWDISKSLEGIGHHWTFDARDDYIACRECDWYADAPFLEAVKLAEQHRSEVKAAVLQAFIGTLSHNDRSEP